MRHVTTRFAGLVILIAGLWGGLIPFVGPYFHFTLGPDTAWHWTTGRLWLSVLPAAAAVLGGLILMGGGPRVSGRFGALLALAGGIWFAVGPDVSMLWNHGVAQTGLPHGRHTITRMLEFLTLHSGIGVLITALAAYSLPGAAAYVFGRRRAARDAEIATAGAAAGAAEAHHRDRVAERRGVGAGAGTAAGTGAGTVAEPGAGTAAGTGATAAPAAAEPAGAPAAAPPTTTHEGTAPPAAPTTQQPAAAQPAPRRRGGLAGLFSRR